LPDVIIRSVPCLHHCVAVAAAAAAAAAATEATTTREDDVKGFKRALNTPQFI